MTNDVCYKSTSAHALIGVYSHSYSTKERATKYLIHPGSLGWRESKWLIPQDPNPVTSCLDRIFSLPLQDQLFHQFHFDTM
jgi:hypothetical protein